jgi:alpha-1,3-fucosyltransferase
MKILYSISNKIIYRFYCYLIIFTFSVFAIRYALNKYIFHQDLIEELRKKNLKSVHLLTGRFAFPNWQFYDGLGEEPFKNCPVTRCYAFTSLPFLHIPLEDVDGVMVHGPNLWYMLNRKTYVRNPKQLWLFYTMESQGLTFCSSHFELTELDDWFNLTATFKIDSSIPLDYKQFRNWQDVLFDLDYIKEFRLAKLHEIPDPTTTIRDLSVKQIAQDVQQRSFIAWYVSHCETYSRRENYVKEMLKYVDIDIYGKCGDSHFPKHAQKDPCKSHKDSQCQRKLFNKYKFYLSFENCLCNDYISEKFWKFYESDKIFRINIIPVVRGARKEQYRYGVKYDKFYINSDNFKTPKDLADYLVYLDRNQTAYLEYFEWKVNLYRKLNGVIRNENHKIRENYNVSTWFHLREPFCQMCSYLHNKTFLENEATNKRWKLSEWFNKKLDCWDGDEERVFLYKIVKFFGYCF